jgi:hypothetical protein
MVWRLRLSAMRGRLGGAPPSPPELSQERA